MIYCTSLCIVCLFCDIYLFGIIYLCTQTTTKHLVHYHDIYLTGQNVVSFRIYFEPTYTNFILFICLHEDIRLWKNGCARLFGIKKVLFEKKKCVNYCNMWFVRYRYMWICKHICIAELNSEKVLSVMTNIQTNFLSFKTYFQKNGSTLEASG